MVKYKNRLRKVKLKNISKKIKVESFIYDGATHAWDVQALDGFKKILN